MWTTFQVIFGFLALLFVFVGNKFSIPILFSAGVACLGLTSMAIGWEAIITRRIVLGWRRHSGRQLYTGISAIFQGVQFNFFGLFLIVVAFLMYFNNGREVFLQMVRRPVVARVGSRDIRLIADRFGTVRDSRARRVRSNGRKVFGDVVWVEVRGE